MSIVDNGIFTIWLIKQILKKNHLERREILVRKQQTRPLPAKNMRPIKAPYKIVYGSYMGIPHGTEMGFATWFHVANPFGSQMGTIRVPYRIGPSGLFPANFWRIYYEIYSVHFCVFEYINVFHEDVEEVSQICRNAQIKYQIIACERSVGNH